MSKLIKIQVDYGNSPVGLNHHERYEERKYVFNELFKKVSLVFNTVLDSNFTLELPIMINIWDTNFLIDDNEYNINNKVLLKKELEDLYKKISSRIYGFNLIWDADEDEEEQQKIIKKMESMKGSFTLSELFDN